MSLSPLTPSPKPLIPEILSPAGSMEKLKFAIAYGADAVYASGKNFGLRNFADNFSSDELKQAVDYVHSKNKKIYVTVNIFPHNEDIDPLIEHLKHLNNIKPDGIIISDLGVFSLAKEHAPDIQKHISVQANNVNYMEVKTWRDMGATRVILARELSYEEIKEIKEKVPDIELELFVHGAICMSYSGRCLLSNYLTGRDANRGECTQSCRWSYTLEEAKRKGEHIPVIEDDRGTYIFNSMDLRTIEKTHKFIQAGIDSFKIEGRMKSAHYVAVTAAAYKKARDTYLMDPEKYEVDNKLIEELNTVSHREYTTGFYFDDGKLNQTYRSSEYSSTRKYMGYIKTVQVAGYEVRSKNTIKTGDMMEIMTTTGEIHDVTVTGIKDSEGEERTHTKSEEDFTLTFSTTEGIEEYGILRQKKELKTERR